jgi:Arc/MetJ-type ribon-helix-helix transcriptional regulator
MAGRRVTIVLNQQQLELLDRTIGKGAAPDRESLIKLAIRELAQARPETVR